MSLDRDELARLLSAGRWWDAADMIARLRPATVAPVADAAPRPEWVRLSGDFRLPLERKVVRWEGHQPVVMHSSGLSELAPLVGGEWEPCAAPAPSDAPDPRRTVGAVVRWDGQQDPDEEWLLVGNKKAVALKVRRPYLLDCGTNLDGGGDYFVRWATREECERHGIPYVERGAAPSPAASPAAYVPKCGDVVALTVCDVTGDALPHRDSLGAHLYRVESDKPDHSEYFKCVRVDGRDTTSPCFISARGMRPATAAERVAAGLDAPAVDREGLAGVMRAAWYDEEAPWDEARPRVKADWLRAADAAIAFLKANGGVA